MMKKNSRVAELLGVEYPVLSAAMSWVTSAELTAAVSEAGGFGLLGSNAGQSTLSTDPQTTATRMRAEIRKTMELTKKPFGGQVMGASAGGHHFSTAVMDVFCEEPAIKAVLCLNDVTEEQIRIMKSAGKILIHKDIFATVDSFKKAEDMGYDAVVVAGVDCGGHSNRKKLGTFTAIPMACEATSLPVIGAGGIIDRKGVAAAGILGAEGIYVGTRFLCSKESTIAENTKKKMCEMNTDECVQVDGVFGPIMSYPTPSIVKAYELMEESHKNNAELVTQTYGGGYRTGMLLGQWNEGIGLLDVSASIGQIHEILTVKQIMEEFAKGMN